MDTTVTVDTPEGVEIELNVAGPIVRAMAWLVDFALRAALYLVVFIVVGVSVPSASEMGLLSGALSILAFMFEWLYPALFEGLTGSTPGKKWAKLKVLQEDGTPVTFPSAIIRNFLRAVDFLPLMYITGLIAMNNNRRFQRLGDLAAGTLVVYLPESRSHESDEESELSQPVPAYLGIEDRLALVSFADRSNGLSEERQIELVNTLEPITGLRGDAAVKTIKAWANWIVRGQGAAQIGERSSDRHASKNTSAIDADRSTDAEGAAQGVAAIAAGNSAQASGSARC